MPDLTKRELFAAMAMQGQLANPNGTLPAHTTPEETAHILSVAAVMLADALIAELEKEPTHA